MSRDLGGLSSQQIAELRARHGWNEVAEEGPNPIALLLKKFWGPSAWMIEIIAALSVLLHRTADLSVALGLLLVNAIISFLQESRALAAVELLRQRLQVFSRALRDGRWQVIAARELVPGDVIRLRLGDIVPADAKVLEGEILTDQSALTGESGDVAKRLGDLAYSGSLVRRGEATCEVSATGNRTYFGRTIQLVQSAKTKLHIEEIVAKLVRWLFLAVGALVAVATATSIARGMPLLEILPLSLVLLMSAVPVALPVMFTVSTAVAARELGARGVLVARLSAAEDAATMDTLCVDKTGTITQNRLSITAVLPSSDVSRRELLDCAALASDAADQDPIDLAVIHAAQAEDRGTAGAKRLKFLPFSPETRRTEALVESPEGSIIVTKGALAEIARWSGLPDSEAAHAEAQAKAEAAKGYRSIAVARSLPDGKRRYLGILSLQDPPRPDSKELVSRLKALGVRVKMLTGDARAVGQEIASQIGLGRIASVGSADAVSAVDWSQCGGLAQVFPETKFRVVEALQAAGHVVGMTGDGINDAPSLKKAEVGIAVSSATDAAKAAASVVLTVEGLTGIVDLVENGRAVYQRLLTWVVNKISRTVLKSGFVVAAYFLLGRFVISALAMILLVFMTDFAKIALSTDNVRPSQAPDTWEIGRWASLGVALGLLMVVESLGCLWVATGVWGIPVDSRQLHTFAFLILLSMAVFSILSIRERGRFWRSRPSGWLLAALVTDAVIGVLIGLFGFPGLPRLAAAQVGAVFVLSAAFALVLNDFFKCWWLGRLTDADSVSQAFAGPAKHGG